VAIYLCLLAFALCYTAARRSLVSGLVAVLGVGYAYGITRANVPETFSHFIFDAGVIGFYIARMTLAASTLDQFKSSWLRPWIEFLFAWPALLFFVPLQDPLIQLVGLRSCVFFLPFMIAGSRLEGNDRYRLALWIAGLSLVAFCFAVAEFFWGIEQFFPRNRATDLIYISKDLVGHSAYRIPSTFANAHAYASTMTMTLPLLVGALVQRRERKWPFYLLMLSATASMLGILMTGTRTHFIIAALLVVVATFSLRTRVAHAFGWLIVLAAIAWTISGEGRLQRFMDLRDPGVVTERISWSVNMSFLDAAQRYPLGNGLGGGGTSIPYWMQNEIRNPVTLENEYARIMLEQGLVGLVLWVSFMIWLLTRKDKGIESWRIGRRLAWVGCACYFAASVTGTGMLTAIPFTPVLLLSVGWVGTREPAAHPLPARDSSLELQTA
jgi:hypothetical protein